MMQDFCRQNTLVGGHVIGPLALRAVMPGSFNAARERRNDRASHLVLDGEYILELAVVAFGPDVPVGLSVDQLHGHADATAGLPHAALQDIVDGEFARPP